MCGPAGIRTPVLQMIIIRIYYMFYVEVFLTTSLQRIFGTALRQSLHHFIFEKNKEKRALYYVPSL